MKWTAEHAVQIPDIDAQHREMFDRAAELRQALLDGEKPARLELLRRGLAAEINGHLSHEERLMRQADYPAYAWHERQHRTARARLSAIEHSLQRGEPQRLFEAVEALAAWMRDHTSVADRMAAAYLRNYWRALDCATV